MRETLKTICVAAFAFVLFAMARPAILHAAAAAGSGGACTVSASPIAFGRYNPLRHADLASVGMLHYRCYGVHRRLIIGLTAGESGSFRMRRMRGGRQALSYNLYLDAAGTEVWGDGTGGSQTYVVDWPPVDKSVSIPIYGRLFGNHSASAGGYQDDVSVVVRY